MIVVNLVGDPSHGLLAESRFVPRAFLPGGEHNMYELAFAAAQGGYDVELRGWLDRATFEEMRDAVGAAPAVELPAREPTADDFVVVPEGWVSPLDYARLLLSPARVAVFVLAAPGLFGWPFVGPDWTRPDPLTVALDSSRRRSISRRWPSSAYPCSRIRRDCSRQRGPPVSPARSWARGGRRRRCRRRPPTVTAPSTSIALEANRWAPLAREVAGELTDLQVDLVEEVSNAEVLERMRRARVLLWPSRIEGHATIPWEARLMGCVPVALSSNRFAVGLDEESGSVIVDSVDEMAGAARALLSDGERWRSLSARASTVSREEVEWDRYVARVRGWAEALPADSPGRHASAGMGAALEATMVEEAAARQTRLEELAAELGRVRDDRDRLFREEEGFQAISAELERVREDRDRINRELLTAQWRLDQLYRIPGVRAAVRVGGAVRRRRS